MNAEETIAKQKAGIAKAAAELRTIADMMEKGSTDISLIFAADRAIDSDHSVNSIFVYGNHMKVKHLVLDLVMHAVEEASGVKKEILHEMSGDFDPTKAN